MRTVQAHTAHMQQQQHDAFVTNINHEPDGRNCKQLQRAHIMTLGLVLAVKARLAECWLLLLHHQDSRSCQLVVSTSHMQLCQGAEAAGWPRLACAGAS